MDIPPPGSSSGGASRSDASYSQMPMPLATASRRPSGEKATALSPSPILPFPRRMVPSSSTRLGCKPFPKTGMPIPTASKATCPSPGTAASTLLVPGFGPRVRKHSALPPAAVVTFSTANLSRSFPAPEVTVKVTATFSSPLPFRSLTETTNGSSNREPVHPRPSSPEIFTSLCGVGRIHSDTSHRRTVASREAEASIPPCGENASALTRSPCPQKVATTSSVTVSRSRIVRFDAEARVAPSGENARELTFVPCPARVAVFLPVATSHNLTVA